MESSSIVIYATLPVLLMALFIFIVYLCCSKKYRLNWFEQTILETDPQLAEEKQHINPRSSISSRSRASSIKYAPLASDSSVASIPSTMDSFDSASYYSASMKEGIFGTMAPLHTQQPPPINAQRARTRAQSVIPAIHTPQEIEESK